MLTEMTHLALPTAWNARRPSEPAHLNSVRNLIPPTDRPTARVPWADHRGWACWSVGPVKGHFNEFHNQLLSIDTGAK